MGQISEFPHQQEAVELQNKPKPRLWNLRWNQRQSSTSLQRESETDVTIIILMMKKQARTNE